MEIGKFIFSLEEISEKDINKLEKLITENISSYILLAIESKQGEKYNVKGLLFTESHIDINTLRMKINGFFEKFPSSNINKSKKLPVSFLIKELFEDKNKEIKTFGNIKSIISAEYEKLPIYSLFIKKDLINLEYIFNNEPNHYKDYEKEYLHVLSNKIKKSPHETFIIWISGDSPIKYNLANLFTININSKKTFNINTINEYKGEKCVILNCMENYKELIKFLNTKGLKNEKMKIFFKPEILIVITRNSFKEIFYNKSDYINIKNNVKVFVMFKTICNCFKNHKCIPTKESLEDSLKYSLSKLRSISLKNNLDIF